MKAEQLTDVVTYHGEGPIWDSVAGVLRWVDMLSGDAVDGCGIERAGSTPLFALASPAGRGIYCLTFPS